MEGRTRIIYNTCTRLLWFLLGVWLMVTDELISEAQYCGPKCLYPIPVIGAFSIWDTWSIAFGIIVLDLMTIVTLHDIYGTKSLSFF